MLSCYLWGHDFLKNLHDFFAKLHDFFSKLGPPVNLSQGGDPKVGRGFLHTRGGVGRTRNSSEVQSSEVQIFSVIIKKFNYLYIIVTEILNF